MLIPKRSVLFALGAAAALAGCGGSSSSGLSKAQLATKANAACSSYNKAANAIPQPPDFFQNPVHAAAYLDKLKALAHAEFDAIAGLTPAGALKGDFDSLVADARRQLALLDSADSKAHARDASGIRDLQQSASLKTNSIDPLLRKLGFTSCLA